MAGAASPVVERSRRADGHAPVQGERAQPFLCATHGCPCSLAAHSKRHRKTISRRHGWPNKLHSLIYRSQAGGGQLFLSVAHREAKLLEHLELVGLLPTRLGSNCKHHTGRRSRAASCIGCKHGQMTKLSVSLGQLLHSMSQSGSLVAVTAIRQHGEMSKVRTLRKIHPKVLTPLVATSS